MMTLMRSEKGGRRVGLSIELSTLSCCATRKLTVRQALNSVHAEVYVVDSSGTVAVVLRNAGAAPLDVPTGTLRAVVFKFE